MKLYNIILMVSVVVLCACRTANTTEPVTLSGEYGLLDPSFSITQPKFGEIWEPGTSHQIRWTSNKEISNVKLELYKKGVLRYTIVTFLENTGSYIWKIPVNIVRSQHYQIRISSTTNKALEGYSEVFYVIGG